ncbi:hypothetical protein B0I37DRAFT_21761 [Chaetomium sp. MPI-CAGE-AT-0009]|nr:hypothetical protein B0I37DRAFT_21761 [Chaetomium sp. MPI-CAGE-AT-0009]
MAPAPNNTQFTYPLAGLVHENTSGGTGSGSRNHRRSSREAAGLDEEQPSRLTDAYSHKQRPTDGTHRFSLATSDLANHGNSMARGNDFSGSSSSWRAAATSICQPEAHWDGGYERAAGKRRYRGSFAAQGSSDSNVASVGSLYGHTGKAQERGSTAALGSGSGSGSGSSSSERGVSSGGLSLTEENVKRTSSYYEWVGRDSAGERGESSGRRASLLATLEEAGSRLSGARR